jgi:hypothetical protein
MRSMPPWQLSGRRDNPLGGDWVATFAYVLIAERLKAAEFLAGMGG